MEPIKNFNPLIPSGMRINVINNEFKLRHFNPLIPSGMRKPCSFAFVRITKFQSTHPKRDENLSFFDFGWLIAISIHSSQAGWETVLTVGGCQAWYFNPLIPSGMRIKKTLDRLANNVFQSTHPKRDENEKWSIWRPKTKNFNPLIPSGMSPVHKYKAEAASQFQSTHPKRDEPFPLLLHPLVLLISIHSSQAGWAHSLFLPFPTLSLFQSTHPKRDEPTYCSLCPFSGWYFNPLIPSGMSLHYPYLHGVEILISIHSSQAGWALVNELR